MRIKHFILSMSCVLCIVASCKKDQTEIAKLNYENAADTLMKIRTDSGLVLSPKISGGASNYQWLLNGESVSKEPVYKFQTSTPGQYTLEFNAENEAGKTTLIYKVKVTGPYADGVLFLSYTDATGLGSAQLSHLDEKGDLHMDVFAKANPGTRLSPGANNLYYFDDRYYITSDEGPNYLTVVDAQTLKSNYVVSQSGARNVTFFATTDGRTGYVSNVRKTGLYKVDLTNRTISSTVLDGTSGISLIPISKINNTIITAVAKKLVKVNGDQVSVINAYKENVSGLVRTSGSTYWVGVQGSRNNKAKLIKLDQNYKGVDSVELSTEFKLPANGVLTSGGTDEYIYWQETSSAKICRFNTMSKTVEEFIDPWTQEISFATSWKVDPRNGDLYIADTPGLFTGEEPNSTVFIFDKSGKLKKTIKDAGFQITDIVFP